MLVASLAVPVASMAFVRLRRFPLGRQILALPLLAGPTCYLIGSVGGRAEGGTQGIVIAATLFLPPIFWTADAVERRFVVWTSRET